jgi:hypothetical protein
MYEKIVFMKKQAASSVEVKMCRFRERIRNKNCRK